MVSRRSLLVLPLLALVALARPTAPALAQQQQIEPAFSNVVLSTYGLPVVTVTQSAQGFDAPRSLPAGRYLVNLVGSPGFSLYLDVVQVPSGLSPEEAGRQLLSAARMDVPVVGWTYGGGTYAIDGRTAWVVIDLTPGEWAWGLTSQSIEQDAEETPFVLALTVTPGTPAAVPEIAPAVDVAMTEFEFRGLEGATVPAGPQVWRFGNVGGQPHHMVLYRTDRAITPADVQDLANAFLSATPTPPPGWWTSAVWVGYEAILSPGQSIIAEFDLSPGTYTAFCFITDTETGAPHLLEGMVQSFTVATGGSATPVASPVA